MYPQSQMEMAGCYMTGVVQYVWCSVCCVVCGGCCVVVVMWYVLCGVCVHKDIHFPALSVRGPTSNKHIQHTELTF